MLDLEIIDHPSPNHDARPDGATVEILLLHYTGMESGAAALAR
ncbi:MAG: N-acetylmuramoyl-L-alanine amidase, partial [Kiloniellaceae bacterium]